MSTKEKIAIACAVSICLAGVLWIAANVQRSPDTYTYSKFLNQVQSGQVVSVIVVDSNSGAVQATYRLKSGKTARAVLPSDYGSALTAMQDNLVNIEIKDSSAAPFGLLMKASPFLLLLCIWIFFMIRKPKWPETRAS